MPGCFYREFSLVWHPSQGIFTEPNAHRVGVPGFGQGMLFVGSASAPQTQTNQTLNTQTLLKIWPMKNVLHNLSPSVVPDPRQTTQYFWVGLLTFALKTILGKKIIFVFTEDQPLSEN